MWHYSAIQSLRFTSILHREVILIRVFESQSLVRIYLSCSLRFAMIVPSVWDSRACPSLCAQEMVIWDRHDLECTAHATVRSGRLNYGNVSQSAYVSHGASFSNRVLSASSGSSISSTLSLYSCRAGQSTVSQMRTGMVGCNALEIKISPFKLWYFLGNV